MAEKELEAGAVPRTPERGSDSHQSDSSSRGQAAAGGSPPFCLSVAVAGPLPRKGTACEPGRLALRTPD
jgi:hypothetical protein